MSVSLLFDDPHYDFPAAPPPQKFYVICSSPRSGSNLLGTGMWRTGAFGAPAEYFNFRSVMRRLYPRLGAQDLPDYVRRLFAARTGPNGVFGFKAHYDHFEYLATEPAFELVEPLHYIYLERNDLVAQAVSLAMAFQTGQWTAFHAHQGTLRYSRPLIDRALAQLRRQRHNWQEAFAELEVEPFRVQFEDLAKDPARTVADIAAWMGVEIPVEPPAVPLPPPLEKQDSPQKRQWLERYRRESGT